MRRVFSLALLASNFLISQAPSPTLGFTKAKIYAMRSSDRPFRIFLNPEIDFAPYGEYLPEWEQASPNGKTWDSFTQSRFMVQTNQIRTEDGITMAWVVREQRGGKFYFQQWLVSLDPKVHKFLALRWAGYDFAGEFMAVQGYEPDGIEIATETDKDWFRVKVFIEKTRDDQAAALKRLNVVSRAKDHID